MASQAKVFVERRKKLAAFLRTPQVKRHFDLGSWLDLDRGSAAGVSWLTHELVRKAGKKALKTFMQKIASAASAKEEKSNAIQLDDVPIYATCGTKACVAGWCPVAFPRSWEYNRCGAPLLIVRGFTSSGSGISVRDFALFFGLDTEEAQQVCLDGPEDAKDRTDVKAHESARQILRFNAKSAKSAEG
jgi:hypothetical protein